MRIDRKALISAGWTPPADDPDYEPWIPALQTFRDLVDGPPLATPLDSIDRNQIDMLRAVLRSAPPGFRTLRK